MDWQLVVAGVLVAGCTAWAVWMFMPAGLRAWCRARLGLGNEASSASGCGGCDGCGPAPPPPGTPQVVKIVRRPRA